MNLPNPLISGFNPDPSIVKVGEDYYLATSTFEYLPGIPVYHSTDLVDWTRVGHVVDREGQLDSRDVPTLGGAWAPTIRFHDGLFYVAVTDAMARGTLVFTAKDPAGPWSDGLAIEGAVGIDQDLAWDEDGTAYLTYSGLDTVTGNIGEHRGILQVRVDLESGKALEEPRSVWSGTGLMFPEAPHLYRHGDYWYLMIAEGGTERGHSVSIARGTSPTGPFENNPANPVLSARSTDRPIQNTGHGDLVQTPDGGWAMVLLGMRPRGMTRAFSALGRETFITPVTWEDGWPVVEPVILNPRSGGEFEDDFVDAELDGGWIAVRRFPGAFASTEKIRGRLTVTSDGPGLDDARPAFLGRRQRYQVETIAALVDTGSPEEQGPSDGKGNAGGLAVRYDESHHYSIEVNGTTVTARARVSSIEQAWTRQVPGGPLELRIATRQPAGGAGFGHLSSDTVALQAVIGGEPVTLAELDGRYLSAETAASFTGRVAGVFASSGTVAFHWFRSSGREPN
ncbi:xylan 1,4-beta-xylosidase [Arthrobacter sp. V4I6]|uniref:glycoside hydrolase family 43 protein n=1 Tax=unclassified Arthrobacter TaxID=235627 RepID=UPI00278ADA2E|nr:MULTISPECIES: glycoside hydrolase family 43 protein [unclassified Arthrobacter]MDQ0823366.1 xylan 1,4-beta-xylosidase [Arthrobacter sp. V1I7]MDQ0852999.1 xylan 1,4-beta-xylosidase [Arthrobacter sp. V4I6]